MGTFVGNYSWKLRQPVIAEALIVNHKPMMRNHLPDKTATTLKNRLLEDIEDF